MEEILHFNFYLRFLHIYIKFFVLYKWNFDNNRLVPFKSYIFSRKSKLSLDLSLTFCMWSNFKLINKCIKPSLNLKRNSVTNSTVCETKKPIKTLNTLKIATSVNFVSLSKVFQVSIGPLVLKCTHILHQYVPSNCMTAYTVKTNNK